MKKVVVFAAHPDDEILGEGGTIRYLSDCGICVHAVVLGEGITSRSNKRQDADCSLLKKLKEDAQESASIIGYVSIDFCDLPDNRLDGMDLLDIVKIVSYYIDLYSPDTIFTHHHGDLNIDHRRVCEAVLTACRPTKECCVKRIYSFETPSSTEWNYTYSEPFTPNVYVDITDTFNAKVKAMEKYRSETTEFPHPRSEKALRSLAFFRGSNIGMQMAEGFMLLREIVE